MGQDRATARTGDIPADQLSSVPESGVSVTDLMSSTCGKNTVVFEPGDRELVFTGQTISPKSDWVHRVQDNQNKLRRKLAYAQAIVADDVNRIFRDGGRTRIKEIVSHGLHEEAAAMLRTEDQPLKKLQRLLVFMHELDLPRYDFLSDETSQVVQAVQYCKSSFLLPNGKISPNAYR